MIQQFKIGSINIGCPNGNPPMFNICGGGALRMHFGSSGLSLESIQKSEKIEMVSYGSYSGSVSVGTIPNMIKSYPVEVVPPLMNLLKVMNEIITCSSYCNPVSGEEKTLNHVELKIYLGKDIVTAKEVSMFRDMGGGNQPPMKEVGWHCDFMANSSFNSIVEDSYVTTLSIGEPRFLAYKKLEKKDNRWIDAQPIKENTIYFPLCHGSLNILHFEDENGSGNIKFKHRGGLLRNYETKIDGKGISVAVVCRSCKEKSMFHGPKSERPYSLVVSDEELEQWGKRMDGSHKSFSGVTEMSGEWHTICADHMRSNGVTIDTYLNSTLVPHIQKHLQKSSIWK